jgi:hypothetical protein
MHPSKVLLATLFFFTLAPWATASKVTYDGRAIIIDGKHRLLVSGSIHYPRSTAQVYLFIFFINPSVCVYIYVQLNNLYLNFIDVAGFD